MRIFDKELFIKDMGEPIGVETKWVNECDGKPVLQDENDEETYRVVSTKYVVAKEWTKEVIEIDEFDEDFFGWDFDKIQKLLLEAKKIIKRPNKTYYFTCPNCGNEAYGGKSSNGHTHVKCETCDIGICQ